MDQPQISQKEQINLAYEAALHMLGKLHGMYGSLILYGREETARDVATATASMVRITIGLAAQAGVEDAGRAVKQAIEEAQWPGA